MKSPKDFHIESVCNDVEQDIEYFGEEYVDYLTALADKELEDNDR